MERAKPGDELPGVELPGVEVVAVALEREGRWLLGRRPRGAHLAGDWEFAGGKVEAGETHAEALRRELREELAIEVEVGALVGRTEHAFERFRARISLYRARIVDGQPRAEWHAELAWFGVDELTRLEVAASNRPLVEALLETLRG